MGPKYQKRKKDFKSNFQHMSGVGPKLYSYINTCSCSSDQRESLTAGKDLDEIYKFRGEALLIELLYFAKITVFLQNIKFLG